MTDIERFVGELRELFEYGSSNADIISYLENWQSARAEGEPVTSWKSSECEYDHSIHTNPDAKAWADFFMATFPNCGADPETMHGWFANAMMAVHDYLQNTHPPAKVPEWVKCSERLPTEVDADFEHRLWCWFPVRKDMKLLLLDQVLQAALSYDVEWMPTGLKRPNPPQTEGE